MSQDFEAPEPDKPEEPKRSAPRLKIPVPPDLPIDDPEQGSPHRRLSTMVGVNFLLSLVMLPALGYLLYRQSQELPPPRDQAKSATPEPAKEAGPEVDRLKSEVAALQKRITEVPPPVDVTPQIKAIDDRSAELGKSVTEIRARVDALGQKVEGAGKGEDFAPAARVDAIDKKLGELAQSIDVLKSETGARTAATPASPAPRTPADVNVEGQAMEQAADLFKQGKYPQARDAFTKLQSNYPEDARVWYFSAITNALASGNWQGGEAVRLARIGVEKEKAGSPDRARIDAVFSDLTPATGKDWLTYFRKQAAR